VLCVAGVPACLACLARRNAWQNGGRKPPLAPVRALARGGGLAGLPSGSGVGPVGSFRGDGMVVGFGGPTTYLGRHAGTLRAQRGMPPAGTRTCTIHVRTCCEAQCLTTGAADRRQGVRASCPRRLRHRRGALAAGAGQRGRWQGADGRRSRAAGLSAVGQPGWSRPLPTADTAAAKQTRPRDGRTAQGKRAGQDLNGAAPGDGRLRGTLRRAGQCNG
jgi:hypothetical protein